MSYCPKCGSPLSISTECDSCGWRRTRKASASAPAAESKSESYISRKARERREYKAELADARIEGEVVDSRVWKDGEGWSAPMRAEITLADGRRFRLDDKLGGLSKYAIAERIAEPTTKDWVEVESDEATGDDEPRVEAGATTTVIDELGREHTATYKGSKRQQLVAGGGWTVYTVEYDTGAAHDYRDADEVNHIFGD